MVVPEGIVSCPLPAMVPPVHVIDVPVRLMAAVPLSVPPCMVRVGTESAEPLLRVRVPPVTVTSPTLVIAVPIVVVPLFFVAPLTLYVALTVFVPEPHCTVPAPLMNDPASKLRASLVLKFNVAPLAELNVDVAAVTAPTLNVPLCTRNWLLLCAVSGTVNVEVPVPPLFLMVPLLLIEAVPV